MAPATPADAFQDYGTAPPTKTRRLPPCPGGAAPTHEGVPSCAVYLRVSTDAQAGAGDSLHVQLVRCLELLDRTFGHGLYTHETFEDPGESGGHGPLPNEPVPEEPYRRRLHALLQGVREGRFTHVVALSLDRLYRDSVGYSLLKRLLDKKGAALLVVLDQPQEGLAGELSSNVLASVGEFARRQTRQRSQLSLDQRKAEGYRLGAAPYGFRHEGDHEKAHRRRNIRPVPEELAVARRIFDMALGGMSLEAVAERLNAEGVPYTTGRGKPWYAAKVRTILHCPAYAGLVADPEGRLIRGLHWEHRVVEPEERDRVLEGLAYRSRRIKGVIGAQPFRLLAGIVHCGVCGHRLESNFDGASPSYRCYRRSRKPGSGGHVQLSAKALEAAVLGEIEALATHPTVLQEARSRVREEIERGTEPLRRRHEEAKKAAQGLRARRSKLTDMRLDGSIDGAAYAEKATEIEARLKALACEAEGLAAQLAGADDRERRHARALEALADFPGNWERLTDLERREFLRLGLERLDVRLEDGALRVRVKLVGLPEREVGAVRGRQRVFYDKPKGPEGLTPRQLAFLAHRKDGRTLRQTASLMGVRESQGYRLRHKVYEWLEVRTDAAAVELCADWIEANRAALPLHGSTGGRGGGRHKRLLTREFQLLCFRAEDGLDEEEIAARHDIPTGRVREWLADALAKAGKEDAVEALAEVRRLGLAPGKKTWQWGTRRRLAG